MFTLFPSANGIWILAPQFPICRITIFCPWCYLEGGWDVKMHICSFLNRHELYKLSFIVTMAPEEKLAQHARVHRALQGLTLLLSAHFMWPLAFICTPVILKAWTVLLNSSVLLWPNPWMWPRDYRQDEWAVKISPAHSAVGLMYIPCFPENKP